MNVTALKEIRKRKISPPSHLEIHKIKEAGLHKFFAKIQKRTQRDPINMLSQTNVSFFYPLTCSLVPIFYLFKLTSKEQTPSQHWETP